MDSFDCAHHMARCQAPGDPWNDSYNALLTWLASLGGHQFWVLVGMALVGVLTLLIALVLAVWLLRAAQPSRA
jgi:hypothetical protein